MAGATAFGIANLHEYFIAVCSYKEGMTRHAVVVVARGMLLLAHVKTTGKTINILLN